MRQHDRAPIKAITDPLHLLFHLPHLVQAQAAVFAIGDETLDD